MLHAISTSDWHLEALYNHFGEEGVDLQLAEIDEIYLYCLENGIEHIFVPGDITDRYVMSDTTKRKLLALLVKYDGKINTHYIGGNHDRADSKRTSMDLISQFCEWDFLKTFNVYLEPTQVIIDKVVCNMLPHPSEESMKHKRPCLNFIHADVAGAMGDNGKPLRTKKKVYVDDRDFTIGGHIHLHQVLKRMRLVLNGSPYQKTFGESLPKGFLEFRAYYSGGELKVSHKFVSRRPKFLLETKIISQQQEFAELVNDRYTRYRLFIEEGVVIPADLRVRLPNIAQVHSLGSQAVKESAERNALEVKQSHAVVHPRKGLKQFLLSNNVTPDELKQCGVMLKEALSELGTV